MTTRILTALIGIPLVLLLLFWPGGVPWLVAVAVVMAMGLYEFTKGLREKGVWVHWIAAALLCAIPLLAAAPYPLYAHFRSLYTLNAFIAFLSWHPRAGLMGPALVLMVLLAGDIFRQTRAPIRNVGATLVAVGYIGGLFPSLALLRRFLNTPPEMRGLVAPAPPPLNLGAWTVLCVFAVIWAGDSAAYFVGRSIGKHKCAPAISPNKTWEGVIGGLVASTLAGALTIWPLFVWLGAGDRTPTALGFGLAFGLIVGAAGQIGDLVESAMKREIGVKDFGALLPGHGGILDRFDSLLFAAPTAYALLAVYLPRLVR